jgi:hypothetical protein
LLDTLLEEPSEEGQGPRRAVEPMMMMMMMMMMMVIEYIVGNISLTPPICNQSINRISLSLSLVYSQLKVKQTWQIFFNRQHTFSSHKKHKD